MTVALGNCCQDVSAAGLWLWTTVGVSLLLYQRCTCTSDVADILHKQRLMFDLEICSLPTYMGAVIFNIKTSSCSCGVS